MKKIKFRGYDTRDGVREMVTFTLDELLAGTDEYELVDPDSVAQFTGYDADGKEVYEGDKFNDKYDKFNDKYGHTLTARLNPQAVGNNGHLRFDWLPDNCEFHVMPDDFEVEEDYINEND